MDELLYLIALIVGILGCYLLVIINKKAPFEKNRMVQNLVLYLILRDPISTFLNQQYAYDQCFYWFLLQ